MRVGKDYFEPKQNFLAVEKDLALIVQKLWDNNNLMKLLYYTQKDCQSANNLTQAQKISMIGKEIKIVPHIPVQGDCPNYIIINLNTFTPNETNPEFRDFSIEFDILCHPDHWNLGDFQLRPYKIAGEIDAALDGKKLIGIGEVSFKEGDILVLNDDLMGLNIKYKAIHGGEDSE